MKKTIFVIALFMNLALFTNGQIGVKGNLHQVFNANPGQNIRGEITITNAGKKDKVILIGKQDFIQSGRQLKMLKTKRSISSWIKLSDERVLVSAENSRTIFYDIAVPKTKLIGDYYSMIFVQEDLEFEKQKGIAANIRMKIGVTVEVKIPGGKNDLEFRLIQVVGKKAYVIVQNSGQKSYVAELTFAIGGHTFNGKKTCILAGGSKAFIFDVDLPDGRTNTMAIIDAGEAGTWGTKRMIEVGILKKKE